MILALQILCPVLLWTVILMNNVRCWYSQEAAYWQAMLECDGFSPRFGLELIRWRGKNTPPMWRTAFRKWESPLVSFVKAGNNIPAGEINPFILNDDEMFEEYFGSIANKANLLR